MSSRAAKVAHHRRGVGTCQECGKIQFKTRDEAKAAKRIVHPDEKMHAYLCGSYWHYGHDELWREIPADDLIWTPLPPVARTQMLTMARATIGRRQAA